MLKLGVNIDHVATLREARYRGRAQGEPDPVAAALACEAAGAHGITAHLREDRRHIQDRDIRRLRESIQTRLNFEMANLPEMVEIAVTLHPHSVCLVPEKRQEVTTEGGLNAREQYRALRDTTHRLQDAGITVSLFIDPDPDQVHAAAEIGARFIELHTGAFAEEYLASRGVEKELDRLREAARLGRQTGLRINAGHGLNYRNLPLLKSVPFLEELNIGHSIISRAVIVGIESAVREMLQLMQDYDPRNRD